MTLARLEAKIVFTKLFERYPNLSYKDEANWGTNDFFRGPNTLIVGGVISTTSSLTAKTMT